MREIKKAILRKAESCGESHAWLERCRQKDYCRADGHAVVYVTAERLAKTHGVGWFGLVLKSVDDRILRVALDYKST